MIAIIADDFTGAAELAGISLRHGLTVELYLATVTKTAADVLVVCTDSRSLNIDDAKKATADAVENILQFNPEFIYKKIDSVLRGHVMEEVKLQMALCSMSKALLMPANPSLGRTISNGEYLIAGKKINETGFINDPEFPVRSALAKEMIGDKSVEVLKYTDALPVDGVVIGEAISNDDIKGWASVIDKTWMLVGAGDFYTAILEKTHQPKPQLKIEWRSPHLYICGTAFNESRQFIKKINEEQNCISYLPETINEEWFEKTSRIIKEQHKVIIAIDDSTASASSLRTAMAKAVKKIVARENIKEIFIEGGSTAAAVLEELDIKKLTPLNELSRGVVRMKAFSPLLEGLGEVDLFITVKPGSYQLPKEIIELYSKL